MRVLASSLDPERFDGHVFVSAIDPEMQAVLPPTLRVHVLPPARSRLGSPYPVLETRRALRRIDADVVLATLRMNMTAWIATRVYRKRPGLVLRVANHVWENRAELTKGPGATKRRAAFLLDRWVLRSPDRGVAQSTAMRDDLLNLGVRPDRVTVITNPMDEEEIRRRLAAPSEPPPESPSLVAVGRLTPQKGFDVLIEALPAVLERHPDLQLTVFGEGPARRVLQERINELGIANSVTLAGQVSDALASVATADLLVAPSRYEGLSNAVLEALCVGVPVVATSGPGASQDLVTEPAHGRLVPPGEPAPLASAIIEVLNSPTDRSRISRCALGGRSGTQVADRYAALLTAGRRAQTNRDLRRMVKSKHQPTAASQQTLRYGTGIGGR